ncbi:hypothetical protein P8C59_005582 [Phyllachora maydis]|uniref:Uncharacterized protein n=1 Tax=Phyllachora maydis TaxID=1825666 RepID=A0AAD9MEM7_9PEZI|nr:hypothetical protein P8C59_005582 [Phyllachora maydis]
MKFTTSSANDAPGAALSLHLAHKFHVQRRPRPHVRLAQHTFVERGGRERQVAFGALQLVKDGGGEGQAALDAFKLGPVLGGGGVVVGGTRRPGEAAVEARSEILSRIFSGIGPSRAQGVAEDMGPFA